MNKVYIILVNYNGWADTIECLESVLKSDYSDYQLFVVDNSQDDTSINNIARWASHNNYEGISTEFKSLVFPLVDKPVKHVLTTADEVGKGDALYEDKLTIIKAENNGFAAANNIVLKYILKNADDTSLIWVLNNDTVVEKDTLSNLVDFYFASADKKQILGAKLRYYNKPDTIQAVAGNYNTWIGKHTHIGEGEVDNGQYDNYKPGKNDYIVGASMFLPKQFLQQAGLMCEDYFLYFEELDWVKTGIEKGFSIATVPNAIVYHKEGASIVKNKDTSVAEYYSITNRVRFIKKWFPFNLITVMIGVIWALVKRLLQGKSGLVKKSAATIIKILFTNNKSAIR